MRLRAVSDLHVNHQMDQGRSLAAEITEDPNYDVLVVAGDLSDFERNAVATRSVSWQSHPMTTRNVKLAGVGKTPRDPGSKNNRCSDLRKRCPECKVLRKFHEPDTNHGGELHPRRPGWGHRADGRVICGWCVARTTGATLPVDVPRDATTGRIDKASALAERAAEKARRRRYARPVEVVVQVNGRERGRVTLPRTANERAARRAIEANERITEYLEGRNEKKFLFVPGKIISITVG